MTSLRGHTVRVLEGKRVFLKDRDSRKSYYDLRHGESDWTLPLTVERVAWVNFYGTLVSAIRDVVEHPSPEIQSILDKRKEA